MSMQRRENERQADLWITDVKLGLRQPLRGCLAQPLGTQRNISRVRGAQVLKT